MQQHSDHGDGHGYGHGHGQGHGHDGHAAEHADWGRMLDLDAEVLGGYRDVVLDLADRYLATPPRTIADLGAGTGTGTLALAARHPDAEILSLDDSAPMIEHLTQRAKTLSVKGIRGIVCNLDNGWPDPATLGTDAPIDLAWAASSLHHLADVPLLLRGLADALSPTGVAVVLEIDALPRFLPDDIGIGTPGLEDRLIDARERNGWNHHPDWTSTLIEAGLTAVDRETVTTTASAGDRTTEYAIEWLGRSRSGLADDLSDEDRATLDALLDPDHPASLRHRDDVTASVGRTVWFARREENRP
ncbi:class I SAM-dependent methyltransferase [Gordonia soli]|uniref:Methyltransferase type 12 domain-containing protein n=1 Tax=Gordonia soli NBRC 108243 TaxID=1223545 RepID=M0QNC7_9ACTN|nr:methyltransferase [Gordonia soli]GAC70170.1 hypothetical protein GS4_32_01140 [Gordonia soli NBRC 108243]